MRTQDEAIVCSNASLPICQIICVMVGHSSNREVYGVFRLRRTQPSYPYVHFPRTKKATEIG